ncbi:unnamed protein product [Knipowitschia caucasica]|uniref:Pre-B-cell leukemia homeobox interacting protein 1a n=1 Tax=Knipowitschia caucasica TaxID=637954 RepID=A0AAV2KAB0_KNICA
MSDHSNSTGSTGSSTNSWTLLSPEEAAVESVGPVDDGTESLGDVPSLSEELAGAAAEFKHIDIPIETVLSEEGHQICQETDPEPSEGPIPLSPSRISPLPSHSFDPPEEDPESQPPVIHDIVATSPSDNDNLSAVPFVTHLDSGASLEVAGPDLLQDDPEVSCAADNPGSAGPASDKPADIGPISETQEEDSPTSPAEGEETKPCVPLETVTAAEGTEPSLTIAHDHSPAEQSGEEPESPADVEPEDPETPAPVEESGDSNVEKEATEEEPEPLTPDEEHGLDVEPPSPADSGDTDGFDDGLRRRHLSRARTSDDEEDEEEELEFKIEEKKEAKPWLSVNKCIVAGLVLLFLGSLFLSGDIDGGDVTEAEQSQEWVSGDPKEMKELLDKLTQENQQISQLEAQLKDQKAELDVALKAVAVSGDELKKADLETENAKLKAELQLLPDLRKELDTLRSRVTELGLLSGPQAMAPSAPSAQSAPSAPASEPGVSDGPTNMKPERKSASHEAHVKEELKRQKKLLEESRKRLETMKNQDEGDRKDVRDRLAEIQKKLSEKVDRWGRKKPESKWKVEKDKEQWKDEKRGADKKPKHKKDESWKEKEVKSKYNSHKEAWRKNQDEWERKKSERRTDREERRKEKPWHEKVSKKSHAGSHHGHKQQQQQPPLQPHQQDFWKHQEQKLNRNIRPQVGCGSVEACAAKEGLYPVEFPEFEELLEGYLSKLDDSPSSSTSSGKDTIRKLTAQFFENGVFIHDRMRFADFAEDVADILEDAVDVLDGGKDNDPLEEEMEEFEREALWKFAANA